MAADDKKLEKLLAFTDDSGLAIFDEIQNTNDNLEELTKLFSGADFGKIRFLQGEPGSIGPKGDGGDQGDKGEKGEKGEKGDRGTDGKNGRDGIDGIDGINGKNGLDGLNGSPDAAEDVKKKIESLQGDFRIDASAIKNLPSYGGVKLGKDGYPYGLPQPAGAMTYKLNGAVVGRGNILNIVGPGITTSPLDDGITYNISGGGGAGGVTFLNGLQGAITLLPGSGISITPSGQNLTIATNETGNPNEIRYFNGSGISDTDANFIRNLTDDRFSFASNVIGQTTNGIFFNGAGAPNALGNHAGLGMDFRSGTINVSLGWTGIGNDTHIKIEDTNLRMLLQAQDFYIDGYNGAHSLFIESTNTYHDLYMGDVGLNTNQTRFLILDSGQTITAFCSGFFEVQNPLTLEPVLAVDPTNIIYAGGDTLLSHNGFRFAIFDGLKTLDFASPLGVGRFGDIDNNGNASKIVIDDDNQIITATVVNSGVSTTDLTLSASTGPRLSWLDLMGNGSQVGGDFQFTIQSSASNGDPYAGTTYDYTLTGGRGIVTTLNDNNGASDTYRADQIFTVSDITTKFTDLNTSAVGGSISSSNGLRVLGAFGAQDVMMYTGTGNVTISDGVSGIIYNPAAVQANATITLPSAPTEGQYCEIFFGGTVTSGNPVVTTLVIAPNAGQTLVDSAPVITATAGTFIRWKWRGSNSRWYRAD